MCARCLASRIAVRGMQPVVPHETKFNCASDTLWSKEKKEWCDKEQAARVKKRLGLAEVEDTTTQEDSYTPRPAYPSKWAKWAKVQEESQGKEEPAVMEGVDEAAQTHPTHPAEEGTESTDDRMPRLLPSGRCVDHDPTKGCRNRWTPYRCQAKYCKGKATIIPLMQQEVSCGKMGLRQFRYEHSSNYESLRYGFACTDYSATVESPALHQQEWIGSGFKTMSRTPPMRVQRSAPGEKKATPAKSHDSYSTKSLAKHVVDCDGNAINSFQLEWDPNIKNTVRYAYTCNTLPAAGPCRTKRTEAGRSGWKTKWLAHHNVKCEEGEVITSFRLRESRRDFFYEYTCCVANGKSAVRDKPATPWIRGPRAMSSLDVAPTLAVMPSPSSPSSQFRLPVSREDPHHRSSARYRSFAVNVQGQPM